MPSCPSQSHVRQTRRHSFPAVECNHASIVSRSRGLLGQHASMTKSTNEVMFIPGRRAAITNIAECAATNAVGYVRVLINGHALK
jgi:hypothetical protein